MSLVTMETVGYSTTASAWQSHNPNQRYANGSFTTFNTAEGPYSENAIYSTLNSATTNVWGLDLSSTGGLGPLTAGGVIGFEINVVSTPNQTFGLSWGSAGGAEFWVGVVTSGRLDVRRGNAIGTLLASTANNTIPYDTFGYLEVYWSGIGSSKDITVRWNNTAIITLTGVNNQGGGGSNHDILTLNFLGYSKVQALYLNNLSGSYPFNSFLGQRRIAYSAPVAANSTQWTANSGTNLSCVSGVTNPGSGTNYNKAASSGLQDTYTILSTKLPSNQPILAIQVRSLFVQTVASAGTVQNVIISGGTTATGSTFTPPTGTAVWSVSIWTTDPNTGEGWTAAAVNALKIGYKSASLSSGELRCFQTFIEIMYGDIDSADGLICQMQG